MTILISNNNPRISYTATAGQTAFTVPFEFFDASDLNVYVNETLKTLTADYTVTGGDGSTGSITLGTGASLNDVVIITRDVTLQRTTDFPTSGPFQVASLNVELDKMVAMVADMKDLADRGLRLEDFDPTVSLTIPSKDNRKGTVLAFNETTGAVEVGPTIADTNSIAQIKADIATLADIQDGTVATNAITTVSSISSDVTTVSSNNANVTTVAGQTTNMQNITDNLTAVQNAATNAATATTKASESAASAVSASFSEAGANTSEANAAISATNASTSATAASTSAAAAASSATAAATSETNAGTSETNAASSATTANTWANAAAISSLNAASSESNAASSATSAASAQTAAESARDSALAAYDNFDDRYLGVKSSDPTVDNDGDALVAGALYFNSTDGEMKVYNGTSWVDAYADGATLVSKSGDTMTGDLSFGDNNKAIFGAGSDLQIYHDGSNSIISDQGTGNLYIQSDGTSIRLRASDGTQMLRAEPADGSVRLYYGGSQKFITTSTGIDVTGTVTADGLTVFGSDSVIRYDVASSNPHTHPTLQLQNQNTTDGNVAGIMLSADNAAGVAGSAYIYAQSETANQKGNLLFAREDGANNPTTSMKLSSNGDISFYEDTGTTAKLFWDASEESLGIGTTSPSALLDVELGTTGTIAEFRGADSDILQIKNESDLIAFDTRNTTNGLAFQMQGNERMRIEVGGNVGIGTNSPSKQLHQIRTGSASDLPSLAIETGFITQSTNSTASSQNISIISGNAGEGRLFFGDTDDEDIGNIIYNHTSNFMSFDTAGTERLRIDSSGNVLVGGTTAFGTGTTTINSSGLVYASRAGNKAGHFNRETNDGEVVVFSKDGTTVGSIGTVEGDIYVGTGDTGLLFNDANNQIRPYNSTAQNSIDNAIDIGRSASRFKDLYLSGTAYVGTSVAANTSDGSDTSRLSIGGGGDANSTGRGSLVQYYGNEHASAAGAMRHFMGNASGAYISWHLGSGSESMRIDSSGRVGIGTSSPDCDFHIAGSSVASLRFGNIGTSANSALRISRDDTSVINNNPLGFLEFGGNDSTSNIDAAFAYIGGVADGTHAAGSNATRLEFATTPSGSSTPVERLRITSAGLVGIGTSSPADKLHVEGNIYLGASNRTIYTGGSGNLIFQNNTGNMIFSRSNGSSESMRLDSSGIALFKTTSTTNTTSGVRINGTAASAGTINQAIANGAGKYESCSTGLGFQSFMNLNMNNSTATGLISFQTQSSLVGSIQWSSSTSYNTSSDYRLKENVVSLTGGIERLKQLEPRRFNFISDAGITIDGFLAHEVQTAVPHAITGEKDAVDEDGNPEYQSIDHSKLVPLLTAALQEAIAKIEDLEARVATLEGN